MDVLDETRPLLAPDASPAPSSSSSTLTARTAPKKRTPLPKMQIAIVMLLHLSEPMSGHCIFPFINQVGSLNGTRRALVMLNMPRIFS